MLIRKLVIHGIFDRQDIEFNFSRSPSFLVGPNGTGKSTALKILHNLLTAQWSKLAAMPFHDIMIVNDSGELFTFERIEFSKIRQLENQLSRLIRRPHRRHSDLYPTDIKQIADFLGGRPVQGVRNTRRLAPVNIETLLENYENNAHLMNFVENSTRGKVLYFPTFRRIEKDLSELLDSLSFISIEEEEEEAFTPDLARRFDAVGEVVGFGGQDISALLTQTADRIEISARQALNDHSVRFLEALSTDRKDETRRAKTLIQSEDQTNELLQRISSFSNINIDISSVRQSISEIRAKLSKAKPGRPTQQQEMMLLYIGEMIALLEKIDNLYFPLKRFAELINFYLRPVKTAHLRREDNRITILDSNEVEISPDQLSSGEKQILALFAFLLLKPDIQPSYIIIDEPELSLSVSWQKTLIRDILAITPKSYLVSATHSPFIFENFDIGSVTSLGDL